MLYLREAQSEARRERSRQIAEAGKRLNIAMRRSVRALQDLNREMDRRMGYARPWR